MNNINPTQTAVWSKLEAHYQQMKSITISELFADDKQRFSHFSQTFSDIMLVDYSKNIIKQETLVLLRELAQECEVPAAIQAMFSGEKINKTENRSVLHVALRNRTNQPIYVDGIDVMPQVNDVLEKMKIFSQQVINGEWLGYSGKAITDVVNIGIGGSDLGPYMVTQALTPYKNHLNMHFISNVDASQLLKVVEPLNPETTLVLVASKSFTTQETMVNAHSVRDWFLATAVDEKHIAKHFVALSTNTEEVVKFGIDSQNMFEFWDWVGGRYSLWSAIGLSIALSIGFEHYQQLLEGAFAMDQHVANSTLDDNIPLTLALVSLWYNNFFTSETEAIFPYDQHMHRFPAYFQQGNMESNGKSTGRDGQRVNYQTGPIIWGEAGTNGQHAFYQLIHQGTKLIPCDFIAPVISHHSLANHHNLLLANFFAQTEALAFGQSVQDVEAELHQRGMDEAQIKKLVPFKICRGNNPTNSLLLKKITPYSLGALIALYEHKIFIQGVIWNIFSFDQWGVELGKQLANRILPELMNDQTVTAHDSSTNGLITRTKEWR